MTAQTATLTDFLLARIKEDERDARVAMGHSDGRWASWNHRAHQPGLRDLACGGDRLAELPTDIDEHIARHDPARVLAECEAKRRIVEGHRDGGESQGYLPDRYGDMDHACTTCGTFGEYGEPWPCSTLRALALPYADHPDWREEWRA